MSVTSNTNKTLQDGDGSTVAFDFTFKIFKDTDLKVYKVTKDTGEIGDPLTLNTDYSVTINKVGEGGTVTFTAAPTIEQQAFIVRDIAFTQPANIPTDTEYVEKTLENALDRGCMISQQLKEEVDRSIKIQGNLSGIDVNLPVPEAGKSIRWDDDGEGFTNTSINVDELADITQRVYESVDNIDIVANDKTNIDTVVNDRTNIDTVANDISNINSAVANLDIINHAVENITTIHFNSVAEMKVATTIKINDIILTTGYYSKNDGGGSQYKVREKLNTDVDNGGTIHFLQNNLVAELLFNGYIDLEQFGCVGDANYLYNGLWYKDSAHTTLATDNNVNLQRAITDANTRKLYINLKGKKYRSSVDLTMPHRGIISNGGGIVGCTCTFSKRNEIYTFGALTFDNLVVGGTLKSVFDTLLIKGNMKLSGNDYGFYYNVFRSIDCIGTLTFDTGEYHSLNENLFLNCKVIGGIHIIGDSLIHNTGTTHCNCDNNMFVQLDISGASLTAEDGTTGYCLLNESYSNNTNHILNFYTEGSPCKIRGKWNFLGIVQGGIGNSSAIGVYSTGPMLADRTNSSLFTTAEGKGNRWINDFMAIAPTNKLIGGNWKYLGKEGVPLGLRIRNMDYEVIGVSDAPDGNPLALKVTRKKPFNTHNVDFVVPVGSNNTLALTCYIKVNNANNLFGLLKTYNNTTVYETPSFVPLENNWFLLRFSADTRTNQLVNNFIDGYYFNDGTQTGGNATGQNNTYLENFFTFIRLSVGTNADDSDGSFIIGSMYVTTEKICALPQFEYCPKEARSNVAPTGGIWKVGDRCYNSVPSSGNPIGWVCTTSGDTRTLTGVTGSITSGSNVLTVSDASNLYVGANLSITGVTGNKLITNISENDITLDSNADATVSGSAVSFVAPVWASMGNLS